MSFVAFTEFMYRQTNNFNTAYFWIKLGALWWTLPIAFLLLFILLFTEKREFLKNKVVIFLIFAPAIFLAITDFTTSQITTEPIREYWGYTIGKQENSILFLMSNVWGLAIPLLSLILCLEYYFKIINFRKKQQAKYISIGIAIPIIVGGLTEVLLPLLKVRVPELTTTSSAGLAIFIGYAIWKYRLFTLNPFTVADNIVSTMDESLILLNPVGNIVTMNKATLNLLGYKENKLAGQRADTVFGEDIIKGRLIEKIIEKGSITNREMICYNKNGESIPIIFSGTVIKDTDGNVEGIVCVSRNIARRKQSEEKLKQAYYKLDLHDRLLVRILETANSILINLDLDTLLQEIVRAAHDSLGFGIVMLSLVDETTGKTRLTAHAGLDDKSAQRLEDATVRMSWKDFTSLLQEQYRIGSCYFFPHGEIDWRRNYNYHGTASERNETTINKSKNDYWHPEDALLAVIRLRQRQIAGVLSVDQPVDGRRPTQETFQTLELFAKLVAVAIENSNQYNQLQKELAERKKTEEALCEVRDELEKRVQERTGALQADITKRKKMERELKLSLEKLQKILEGTVRVLSVTTEMKDPYTAGHQQRVSQLAFAIARELGISEKEVEGIRVGGILHDIGKIHVPSEILSKPARLTEGEFNIIKAHTQVGCDILKNTEFPWPVALIALQHHERINGAGYPSGLLGDKILLEAKIIGVADVVEAMASHRPYRPALGIEKALEEITKNKGILYEPDVVDACVEVLTKKGFKFEEW